jgi:hypothetical protein
MFHESKIFNAGRIQFDCVAGNVGGNEIPSPAKMTGVCGKWWPTTGANILALRTFLCR